MTILILDDDGFIAGTCVGGIFQGSFESLCRAHEVLGEKIEAAEYEASASPVDFAPEQP